MLNGNRIQRLKTVDDAQTLAIFLNNAEPSRPVRRVGRLVNTCSDFPTNQRANFFINTWGNGDIAKHPRFVLYDWDFYGREKLVSKVSSFGIVPGEAFVLKAHEVVHKCLLGGPKEVGVVYFVDKVATF